MALISKDLSHFPPFLVQGSSFKSGVTRFWLRYSEFINISLTLLIFINYFLFCQKSASQLDVMITINFIITIFITLEMLLIKLLLIWPLYFNKNYYGSLFICFDVISGPVSLLLMLVAQKVEWVLPIANICIMMRVNCLEKIRIIILDVIYIGGKVKSVILAIIQIYYVYSFISWRLFQDLEPNYNFGNVFYSMLALFQVITFDSFN